MSHPSETTPIWLKIVGALLVALLGGTLLVAAHPVAPGPETASDPPPEGAYALSLRLDPREVDVAVGGAIAYTAWIGNLGSATATVQPEIDYDSRFFDAQDASECCAFDLAPGESREMRFTLRATRAAAGETHAIRVYATATQDPDPNHVQDETSRIHVVPASPPPSPVGFGVAIGLQSERAETTPGDSAFVDVVVANTGTRAETVSLAASGSPHLAFAFLTPDGLHLGPGESRRVTLRLGANGDAPSGVHDYRVTATVVEFRDERATAAGSITVREAREPCVIALGAPASCVTPEPVRPCPAKPATIRHGEVVRIEPTRCERAIPASHPTPWGYRLYLPIEGGSFDVPMRLHGHVEDGLLVLDVDFSQRGPIAPEPVEIALPAVAIAMPEPVPPTLVVEAEAEWS